MASRSLRSPEAGFTLLEVIVALTLLGLLYAAAFGVFAAGMRSSGASANYTRAVLEGERILNEILTNGMASDTTQGVLDSGYRWKADRVRAPSTNNEGPAQLLRVQVSVWWPSPRGEQQFDLETWAMAPNHPPATNADGSGNRTSSAQPRGDRP